MDHKIRHKYVDQNTGGVKRFERLFLGTSSAGIIVDITKKGLEINGYYLDNSETMLGNLREPLEITWENMEKIRKQLKNSPLKKGESIEFDENPIDTKDLENLPKVTINGSNFYVDVVNKLIRPVDNPNMSSNISSLHK